MAVLRALREEDRHVLEKVCNLLRPDDDHRREQKKQHVGDLDGRMVAGLHNIVDQEELNGRRPHYARAEQREGRLESLFKLEN